MSRDLSFYEALQAKGRDIRLLSSISMLLEWDQETFMPKEGIELRSGQMELLSSLLHKEKTGSSFRQALEALVDLETGDLKSHPLSKRHQASVKQMHEEYLQEIKLPNSFVKKLAKAMSHGVHAWQQARETNNFAAFLPFLETIVTLHKEKAELLGYENHPYNALLHIYEPGMTTQKLDELFGTLKPFLIERAQTLSSKEPPETSFLSAHFPIDEQKEVTHFILEKMGVDFNRARLDLSAHPFCLGLHPQDVRLTCHTSPTMFFQNISGVIHEGGHALYELGLPPEDFGTPLGDYCSIGIHESQSKWWECFIGQGRPFWNFFLPELQKRFPKQLKGLSDDPFLAALNQVKPSLIRIFADEVTYVLHIILRYEIERDMMANTIDLKNLPQIWNDKMEELLGIRPETDAEGCLQDVHWGCGLIGYFPTYALGNLYAAQLFETFESTFPEWETRASSGDFSFIRTFLLEKIHRHGREYHPLTLIEKATGAPLSPHPFINYLKKKYC